MVTPVQLTSASTFAFNAHPALSSDGATGALHHAAYAPDGSIVFEADWAGEQIRRLAAGAAVPTQVSPLVVNDNSPYVLTDGRIASLCRSVRETRRRCMNSR